MFWRSVAGGADLGRRFRRILMWVVAGHARRLAFEETSALAEVDRLMADIPGILEVGRDALRGRHAMALSAFLVELRWLVDVGGARLRGVLRSGTMAGFAAHSRFKGPDRARFVDAEFAGGMALKAAEHTRIRSEGLVLDSCRCAMARGEGESAIGVEGEAMFEVGVLVDLRDVSDGLRA